MPLGKVRNTKRGTSTSYASTITTVVFIALCVLGVWMLTSNSLMPPLTATTARTATTTTSASATNNDFSSSTNPLTTTTTTPSDRRDPPATYEDNPGQLPDDAIKSDEENEQKSESGNQKNSVEDTSNEGDNNSNNKQQESEKVSDNGYGKNDKEEKAKEENSSVVEENPHGLQGKESVEEEKKQKESENQISEESSTTQNQHHDGQMEHDNQNISTATTEETPQMENADQSSNKNNQHGEQENRTDQEQNQKNRGAESDGNLTDSDNKGSDEDQQHRMQQQQQQEQKRQENEPTAQSAVLATEQEPKQQRDKATRETQQSGSSSSQETKQDTMLSKEKATTESNSGESFPVGENSGIPKESKESKKSWLTQADQSENQKERRNDGLMDGKDASVYGYTWELCNVTAGPDYIPCLDNEKALRKLRSTRHFEHRERHCPEDGPTCLVPLPDGYKRSIEWPKSRDKIWYHNVPHTLLAEVKGHQNWVKVTGEFLTFPGGGTQFIHGALHYIDFLQQAVPNIAWGKNTRVILDVGCGVASFGGYLFDRDVLTMSFAPKDEHEAQVQFALERGIPAISAVMGSQRLPFPSRVFDVVHCARCRVPWHAEGGALLLELNRVLRPGGYFVWSATPVYQKLEEDVEIWKAMSSLTKNMCWELVTIKKDKLNSVGAAIYRKPSSNDCYDQRKQNHPPMCKNDDDPNAAWYVPLQACMHRAPVNENDRGSRWPEKWPRRLQTPPYWLNSSQMGIYGKPAHKDFEADFEHWKRVVKLYLSGLGISWSNVRNVMDMRAVYGGFAAALRDLEVWVVNVVNVDSPDTLPIIYERGLFGIYHDWCESFSTYPRTYDLLHADHLFSRVKKRCKIAPLMAEIDRIVRPGGKLIVRDESSAINEVENLLKSLHWVVHLTFSKNQEGILSAQKSDWRPEAFAASS